MLEWGVSLPVGSRVSQTRAGGPKFVAVPFLIARSVVRRYLRRIFRPGQELELEVKLSGGGASERRGVVQRGCSPLFWLSDRFIIPSLRQWQKARIRCFFSFGLFRFFFCYDGDGQGNSRLNFEAEGTGERGLLFGFLGLALVFWGFVRVKSRFFFVCLGLFGDSRDGGGQAAAHAGRRYSSEGIT